ncbi:hypothetical protein AT15_07240 [Kosmotoga arenicorallina S304]|uniref:ComEC/Rec2-related protein domain-containing protein n=1 Tax=Kosmotoga arenicorallina S304 TaxID=1453497 RepID=A0A176K2V6_9BACT|nr:ComEC/Rec2 family competence protein [Kosmotoga arenicorallina]OAA31283.1 hypothetical protein AT15_07240 [Kosmotoga arenicorallina S304]
MDLSLLKQSDSPLFIFFVSMAFGIMFSILTGDHEILKGVLILGPFLVFCWMTRRFLPEVLLFFFFGSLLVFTKADFVKLEPGSVVEITGQVKKVYTDDFFMGKGRVLLGGEWRELPYKIMVSTNKSFVENGKPDSGKIFWAVGKVEGTTFQPILKSEISAFVPPIGMGSFAENVRNSVKSILAKYGVTNALVFSTFFGNKAPLDNHFKEALKNIGISHIFAVSGLHVGLFYMIISYFMSLFLLPYHVKDLFSIFLTAAYVVCTGPVISASRAFLMLLIYVIFRAIDYPQSPLNILGLSGIIMLGIEPFDLVLPDFQLSFLSTSGILLCVMAPQKKRPPFIQALLIGGAAQGVTLPVSLNLFGNIALLAIPLTLVAVEFYLIPALVGTFGLLFFDIIKIKPLAFIFAKGLEFLSVCFEIVVVKLSEFSPVLRLESPYNYFAAFFVALLIVSLLFFSFAHSEQSP